MREGRGVPGTVVGRKALRKETLTRPAAIYVKPLPTSHNLERMILHILRRLAANGRRVDLLVDGNAGELFTAAQQACPGLRVISLSDSLFSRLLSAALSVFAVTRESFAAQHSQSSQGDFKDLVRVVRKDRPPLFPLLRYLHRTKPVAVLSFLNDPNVCLLLSTRLYRGTTRFMANVRNHITAAASEETSERMRAMPGAMRRLFPQSDLIVVPSESLREDVLHLSSLPGERVRRIWNAVSQEEIHGLAQEALDHRWFREKSAPVILAVGKLKPQKDYPTLLRAFARLRSRRPARLIILGDGPLMEEIGQLAQSLGLQDDLDLPGRVDNPYPYFAKSDLLVLSSAWEGQPNVLIEALACGCPIVSTDCPGGAAEILEGGRHGRLVPVGDAAAMAEAMEAILASPPSPERLRARAADFSIERAVAAYEELLFGQDAGQAESP